VPRSDSCPHGQGKTGFFAGDITAEEKARRWRAFKYASFIKLEIGAIPASGGSHEGIVTRLQRNEIEQTNNDASVVQGCRGNHAGR
jgi:hypothetical protein